MESQMIEYDEHTDTYVIEATVEHTTEKAWLIHDTGSGHEAWLPKSQADMVSDKNENGVIQFRVKAWWVKKNWNV